jgi:transcriptional regulator GlxA family with amidase domain
VASAITGPMDAFRIANAIYSRLRPKAPAPFVLSVVSAAGDSQVNLHGGFACRAQAIDALSQPLDALIVPSLQFHRAPELYQRARELAPECALLQSLHARGCVLAASCSGTFVLAASGLLDQRRATTSWWLAPSMREYFPSIELETNAMVVPADRVITAGAVTASFSLVLHLIERFADAALAQNTAKFLLVDYQRESQAAFVAQALMQKPANDFVDRVERYMQQRSAEPGSQLSVQELAEHVAVSQRTLQRKFRALYRQTPQNYFLELKIERAKALLASTRLSLPDIIERCGYQDLASFRKLFKRICGVTPADYRARFAQKLHRAL